MGALVVANEATAALSAEEIRAEVHRFWNAFSGKSRTAMESFYSSTAMVFAAGARRIEPSRLTVARRLREYFGPLTTVRTEIGEIDIHIAGEIGVAAYTFRFHATKIMGEARTEEDMQCGRATQVFQRDRSGVIKIVHEHLSSAKPLMDSDSLKSSKSTLARV